MNHNPLLSLANICFSFPAAKGGNIHVLSDISMAVRPREVVAILGPSGCGKSTFLRILAGLLSPKEGERTLGEEFSGSPLAISMNFQKPVLLPWLTVSQNALLPFELTNSSITKETKDRLERLLNLVGMFGFRDAFPSELSGGMLMRAALIRSFVTEPQLLLMDEPFASLDEVTRNRLCVELRALAQGEDATIVFVTHSIQEAVFIANRVVVFSARPSRIVCTLDIDLPPERTEPLRRSERFLDLCDKLRLETNHG